VRALERARPATTGSLSNLALTSGVLALLPPVLGPEAMPADKERREAANRRGLSWAALDHDAVVTVTSPTAVHVKGQDWRTDVTVLARGDLDADGRDDLLVQTVSSGEGRRAAALNATRPLLLRLCCRLDEQRLGARVPHGVGSRPRALIRRV
jgi:hypothetical protein